MICHCADEAIGGPLACLGCEKMENIHFKLDITPTAQARARHGRTKTGFSVTYKSDTQEANERTLEALLSRHTLETPKNGPLVLEFVAALPVPRSDSKRTREAKLGGFLLPTKKPDLDNLAKQLKDAMTRLQFWHDDSQVVCLRCEKIYAETGYWEVALYEAVPRGVSL